MRLRRAWLIFSFCCALVLVPNMILSAESTVTVGPIDSAGIEKLIKDSRAAIIVGMAAWCFPCREELPTLVKLYNKYRSQGLKIIGISIDLNGPSAIQPVVDSEHVNFPVYWGGEKAVQDLKMQRLPMLLFVKGGAVVEEVVGRKDEAVLDKKICELLK